MRAHPGILGVDMFTCADLHRRLAHDLPIFDDRIANSMVAQGEFMPGGDVGHQRHAKLRVARIQRNQRNADAVGIPQKKGGRRLAHGAISLALWLMA